MIWDKVVGLGQRQFGMISREQALAAGLSSAEIRWALERKRFRSYFRGVYRFSSAPPRWEQAAIAALLWLPEGAALSHDTAAFLWGFPGFTSVPKRIEVSVPQHVHPTLPAQFVVHRHRVMGLAARRGGLALTFPARTVIDLAATLEERRLEVVMDHAQLRLPDFQSSLERELGRLAHSIPGRRRLAQLLRARGVAVSAGRVPASPFETDVHRALRGAGLPPFELQHLVFDQAGLVMTVDFAWVQQRVVVHADGRLWHSGRKEFDRDAHQRSRLAVAGWVSIVVTATMRPSEWLPRLRNVLAQRAEASCASQAFAAGPA